MEEKKKMTKSKIYMIIGICVLVLAIGGSTYAYYAASKSATIEGRAAGAGMELTIESLSTSADANGDLIPLDNSPEMLSTAALGYDNSDSFDSTKSCIDKNGYSVCQVYKITLSNTSTVPLTVNGGVQLSGSDTPNIDCANMVDSTSVTNNATCKGSKTLANNYT